MYVERFEVSLSPIIAHPVLDGRLNRKSLVIVPDPFFPSEYKRKKQSGYARLGLIVMILGFA